MDSRIVCLYTISKFCIFQIFAKYEKIGKQNGFTPDFDVLYKAIKAKSELGWKLCQLKQMLDNAKLQGKPLKMFQVQMQLIYLKHQRAITIYIAIFSFLIFTYTLLKTLNSRKTARTAENR